MLKYLQKFLGKLGDLEYKHFYLVVLFILIVTGFALVGITKLEFESDFSKFDPKGIPIVDLNKKIGSKFPGFSSFLVIVQLDDDFESDIQDIRDPKVMEFLIEISKALEEEQKIQEVSSAGVFFQQGVPESLEEVKFVLSQIPGSDGFFNSRYSLTPVFISADVSGDSDKINEMNNRVRDIVEGTSKPGGIKVAVTGEPPLLAQIFDLMVEDGLFTLILATVVIFFMLFIIQRSFKDAIVIILPVLFGVCWTVGGMGWFGIQITIATAAIGAMLLGLGVEYSIFLNSRYKEEKKDSIREGLVKALSTTGASTFSSGATTMIGFLALTLSVFPMLGDLGFSLGMGIALILGAVMIVGPIMIITRDRFFGEKLEKGKLFEKNLDQKGEKGKLFEKNLDQKEKKESRFLILFEKYGSFVSNRAGLVIIIAVILTVIMFYGSNFIRSETIDFDTILPEDLEELKAFKLMRSEFEDTTSIIIFIELDSSYTDSNEPSDIRDPRIIKYANVLSEKAMEVSFAEEVKSVSVLEKEANNGVIPGSLAEQKELLREINVESFITKDYSAMLVKVILNEVAFDHGEEIIKQVYEIVENTEKPVGVTTQVAGGIVVGYELDRLIGPDSSKTAIVAFGIIIVFLFLLSRSVKYTILPLVTVIVTILWILGMIGYFDIGWNSIISSVISMSIGIGIDFGIQLSNRFRQELEKHDKKEAMKITLKYTLYPMIITVVAALIGFQAMNLGQLKLMGDLGKTMSFAMISSMIVAVSLVAGLMVVFEKNKKITRKLKKNSDDVKIKDLKNL